MLSQRGHGGAETKSRPGVMKLKLIYGNMPFWRAEVSRLALYLGGIEFDDERTSWSEVKELKEV